MGLNECLWYNTTWNFTFSQIRCACTLAKSLIYSKHDSQSKHLPSLPLHFYHTSHAQHPLTTPQYPLPHTQNFDTPPLTPSPSPFISFTSSLTSHNTPLSSLHTTKQSQSQWQFHQTHPSLLSLTHPHTPSNTTPIPFYTLSSTS